MAAVAVIGARRLWRSFHVSAESLWDVLEGWAVQGWHRSPGLTARGRCTGRSRPFAADHQAARGRHGAAGPRPRALQHILLPVSWLLRPRRWHDRAAWLS